MALQVSRDRNNGRGLIAFSSAAHLHTLVIYAVFIASALVTAGLFALAARMMFGIEHAGILVALGIIGAGLQTIAMLLWYLRFIRAASEPKRALDDSY
jgi:hypothetical protein